VPGWLLVLIINKMTQWRKRRKCMRVIRGRMIFVDDEINETAARRKQPTSLLYSYGLEMQRCLERLLLAASTCYHFQSIAMSVFVRPSVCPRKKHIPQFRENFVCMLPARSFSGGVSMYVFPVLWMTSCFHKHVYASTKLHIGRIRTMYPNPDS